MDTTKIDEPAETEIRPDEEARKKEADEGLTPGTAPEAAVTAGGQAGEEDDDTELDEDERDLDADAAHDGRSAVNSASALPGAASVVGAALGLASLTGTWIGTQMGDRQQLLGQIKSQSGSAASQISAIYGSPWHTTALFNGLFGLVAILVAGAVLLRQRLASGPSDAQWVKAVAWGALVLGVIGLLIAGAMYSDLFTSLPSVPAGPAGSAGPTG